VTNPKGHSNW